MPYTEGVTGSGQANLFEIRCCLVLNGWIGGAGFQRFQPADNEWQVENLPHVIKPLRAVWNF